MTEEKILFDRKDKSEKKSRLDLLEPYVQLHYPSLHQELVFCQFFHGLMLGGTQSFLS